MKKIIASVLAAALFLSGMPVSGQEFTDSETESLRGMEGFTETDGFAEDGASEEFTSGENSGTSASENASFASEEETEETEEGVHYIKGRPLTEEEREEQLAMMEGLTPLPETPEVGSSLLARTYALYPSAYDSREKGIVTIAKNQHPFGICWAFGMASILETSALKKGLGEYDLSEEHLAYFFANRETDPLGNTAKDRNSHQGNYHEGGNDYLASLYLTSWSGMTTELRAPLPTDANHVLDLSKPLPPSMAYESPVYLKNASFSDYSVDRMKQMVMSGDSVAFMYYMGSEYYNPDTGGYACPGSKITNHVSVVVGWDDNYSKENFLPKSGVTSDGAWIVKNSWGPEWGELGYFYLSYEDKNIKSLVTAEAAAERPYPNNYFYDGSSGMSTLNLGPGQSLGNVFTAKAGKGRPEILGEINVATYGDNANYSIQVYTDVEDEENPLSGNPAYTKPVKFTQPIAGVQTIEIPEVFIGPGTKYSVVIRNEGVNSFKFCVEKNTDHTWVKCLADIRKGQGFWADSKGNWSDLYASKATPRIKAHTRTVSKGPAPALKASAKSYNQIKLSWEKQSGVSGCIIYRTEAGKKKKLAEVSGNTGSYTDSTAKLGVKYSYSVTPYTTCDGKKVSWEPSKTVSASPALNKPVFEAKAYAEGYNKITWKKVPGASGYRVYRKTPSGSWKLLSTVKSTATQYQDKKAAALSSYIYTVRAFRTVSGKTYTGKYIESAVLKTAPAVQKVASVSPVSGGIRIRWQPQKKCDGYRIYRKKKNGSWETVKTISSGNTNSYLDKTAQTGVLYYYAVKAYVKETYGNVYSKYTASPGVTRK